MTSEKSNLQKALDCIEHPSHPAIQYTPGRPFGYHVMNLIREDLSIDIEKDQISLTTVIHQIEPILKEAVFEDNPEDYFNNKISEYISGLKQADPVTYEVAFPLNIEPEQGVPEEFDVRGRKIEQISRDTWINEYTDPACWELDKLSPFLRRSPNDEGNEQYSYWVTRVSANGPGYAAYDASLNTKLLLAKINYSRFLWTLHPISSGLPKTRWSRVEMPYFTLVFEDGEPAYFQISDYDSRKPTSIPWDYHERFRENFNSFPKFDIELSNIDKLIVESLYEYQDGLTTRRRKDAFFSIWRAVETLTQTNKHDPAEETVDRALFALQEYHSKEEWTHPFRDTMAEIDDLRNEIAHEAGETIISQYHHEYTKLLLDGLFEFYFEYRNQLSPDEMRYVLRYGAQGKQCIADVSRDISTKEKAVDVLEEIFDTSEE